MEILMIVMLCTNVRLEFETQFTFFVAFLLLWGFLDYSDVIYNNSFKLVFLFTDLCLLISNMVDLLN